MKNSDRYEETLGRALEGSGFGPEDVIRPKLAYCAEFRAATWPERPICFLDFGCGPGRLAARFHAVFGSDSRYVGYDPDPTSMARARSLTLAGAGCFYGEADQDRLAAERFDMILAAGVFHHIPPVERAGQVKFLSDLLAENGVLIVWEHNPFNPLTRWIVGRCAFDEAAALIRPRAMRDLVTMAGLADIRCDYVTFFPGFMRAASRLERRLRRLPLGGQYVVSGRRPGSPVSRES